jgi:uncharacterized protein (TIGR02722 family)
MRSFSSGWVVAAIIVSAIAGGCSKQVRYGDAKSVETVNLQFGSTDLQVIAEAMTRSLLQAPVVADGSRPIVTVQDVRNKTSEYIDTRAITDSIRAELQKSGRVRFAVDETAMQEQISELERQQSEYYDEVQSAEIGRMVGAAYRLQGSIISIVKENDDVKDVYYKFNLQLWNVQNGLLEWSDEKDIRKTES